LGVIDFAFDARFFLLSSDGAAQMKGYRELV
jgi:hypothetical protein